MTGFRNASEWYGINGDPWQDDINISIDDLNVFWNYRGGENIISIQALT